MIIDRVNDKLNNIYSDLDDFESLSMRLSSAQTEPENDDDIEELKQDILILLKKYGLDYNEFSSVLQDKAKKLENKLSRLDNRMKSLYHKQQKNKDAKFSDSMKNFASKVGKSLKDVINYYGFKEVSKFPTYNKLSPGATYYESNKYGKKIQLVKGISLENDNSRKIIIIKDIETGEEISGPSSLYIPRIIYELERIIK
jgi:hypothetical protein